MTSLTHVVVLNWKDRTHPETGGAEVYCENIARELAAEGLRVTYVTSRPVGAAAHDARDGYSIRRFGGTFTVYVIALLWLLRHRREIDGVIDSQNGIPFFSPLVLRRRTAVTMLVHHVHQDQFGLYFPPIAAAVGRWLEKTAARRVYGKRYICVVSPSTRAEVRRLLRLKGPVAITPNGYRRDAPPASGRRADRPIITCVGRLVPHKRWHLLVEATSVLIDSEPDLVVNLIGSGPEQQRLRHLIEARGLEKNVKLHGFVSDHARDRMLAEAWLTVSTSIGEGWGLSIIEAAAQGVPAVALDVPGLRDSVRSGVTGWLTSEADLEAAIHNALIALRQHSFAAAMQESCVAWADALTWPATAARFRGVLSAEHQRLRRRGRHRAERRSARADSSTVVSLTYEAAARLDVRRLRLTDQATFCGVCVDVVEGPWRLLLNGADDHDALAVFQRLDLDIDSDVTGVALCRSRDLIQWHGDALPHNAIGELAHDICPVPVSSLGRLGERRSA